MKSKQLIKIMGILFLMFALSGCSQETVTNSNQENDVDISATENQEENIDEEVTIDEEETTIIENDDNRISMRVISDVLNIQSDSNIESDVIGELNKNEIFKVMDIQVLEQGEYWYQVEKEGITGWVAGWYCIDNNEYENNILKSHLLPAFDGEIPPIAGTIEMTYDEVVSLYDGELEETYFLGGQTLYNEQLAFQFGDSGMVFINVHPEGDIYGVSHESTLEKVKAILGDPDQEYTVDDPESMGFYEDGAAIICYLTGSYKVKFVFNDGIQLTSIELSKLNFQIEVQ